LAGAPLLEACIKDANASGCKDALQYLRNPLYLGDQPDGTQVSGWIDAWQSAASAYVVVARNAADVAAAVSFARKHNLRLVVKGGGHSYQGTSNAADSLLVWTRKMNRITLHDAFVGEGCAGKTAPQPAVTMEAGAMWIDAYDAVTTKAGRYVQGGGCTTVGVAGHIQSGGFGSLSKGFGTAASNLLEAQIVTADGLVRTVNACKDPELFWALKGGGGGSWGVVTQVTVRTHELPELFGGAGGTIQARTDRAFRELLSRMITFYQDKLFNAHWGEQFNIRPDNTLHISMVCQGLPSADVDEIWRPMFEYIRSNPDLTVKEELGSGTMPARHFWDAEYRKSHGSHSMIADPRPDAPPTHVWWSGDQEQVGIVLYGYESAWLPASLLAPAQRQRLVDALFAASRHQEVGLHFNKGLAGGAAEHISAAANTATNPQALSAFALAIIADGGPPVYPGLPQASPADIGAGRQSRQRVNDAMRELKVVAPDAGSYVSESNFFEPAWQRSFWGERNYRRLRAVKAKYDPEGLFFVHHGVGSEEWSADGFTVVVDSPTSHGMRA
jgi:FAD/FMN-containing dehydrogenase